MNDDLKNKFTVEEIELIGTIRESSDDVETKVKGLFSDLDDPLLSSEEIAEMLAIDNIKVAISLAKLREDSYLESSTTTTRPLDIEGIELYRIKDIQFSRLKIIATESDLGDGTSRYHFTLDGRLLRSIAKVDRLDAISGEGQQREEVKKHVRDIAQGISAGTQVPNSVILAFDEAKVTTEEDGPESFVMLSPLSEDWIEVNIPGESGGVAQRFREVVFNVPFRKAAFDGEKTAFLVDGQQRTAALYLVDVSRFPHFYLTVNAVIADQEASKRVFQVANQTVKISTQFSRALMASMDDAPEYLRSERTRAQAVYLLALKMDRKDNPFRDIVQYPNHKSTSKPPIAYNSMFQVVKVFAEGSLPLEKDADLLARVVARAFSVVESKWPKAWGQPASKSRLMHGAGLRAIGELLNEKLVQSYASDGDIESPNVWEHLDESISRLVPIIIWTDEEMASANKTAQSNYRNEISGKQNTAQDISKLSNWLRKESLDLDVKAMKKK